jgi:hypothetical protein
LPSIGSDYACLFPQASRLQGLGINLLTVKFWYHSVRKSPMRFLPSFAAAELMQVSDEATVLRDNDCYRGRQWNLAVTLNAKWIWFLRETAGFHDDSVLQQPAASR